MANILRQGSTPQWGVKATITGLILDSFNESTEIKDYEQTDQYGAVCGYLAYDQTINFDFSGTLLNDKMDSISYYSSIGSELAGITAQLNMKFNDSINTPSTAILKAFSTSASAGSGTTVSGSGTIYDFGSAKA